MSMPPVSLSTAPPKTILLLGSSGFIGQRVTQYLKRLSFNLRTPTREQVNFMRPNWQPIDELLSGVDVVINMVGIMSQDTTVLEQVHHHTPLAIAKHARALGVEQWVNLSALGADADHRVAFLASKGRGDKALMNLAALNFNVRIARPSLVFGRGGASCEMFLKGAKLPVLMLPKAGQQLIQPVHVKDVVQGLVKLAVADLETLNDSSDQSPNPTPEPTNIYDAKQAPLPNIINFSGAQTCTVADYLTLLRTDIHHLQRPLILSLPTALVTAGITLLTPFLSEPLQSMMSADSLRLLNEGSIADNKAFSRLLKKPPLSYKDFSQYI